MRRNGRWCRWVGGLPLLLGTRQPWITGSSWVHSEGEMNLGQCKELDKRLVASEVSECDGFDSRKAKPDLHTVPQCVNAGKVKDSTLNHHWRPTNSERVLTFGHDSRVWKVAVTGQTIAIVQPSQPQPLPLYAIANLVRSVMLTLLEDGKYRLVNFSNYWVFSYSKYLTPVYPWS